MKKDEVVREYICGCSKAYGANSALFTHVVRKHDGEEPEGTKKPSSENSKGNRGRPKEIEFSQENQIRKQTTGSLNKKIKFLR